MTGQRKAELAILAAPFALVLVLHVTTQVGPRSLSAQPRQFETPAGSTLSQPTHNRELTQWISSLYIGPDMRSPMDHGPTPDVQVATPIDISPTSDPVFENPLKSAMLTSVIGTGQHALVVIDGRLLRMNDEPAPGCRITYIDAKRQMVGVTLPTGEVFYVHAKHP
ncbi:MAG: hypothetical protein IIB04_03560 [Acidobacteria bacterium]|nr:hypothetical protein [Acidobacteriota bacterium]